MNEYELTKLAIKQDGKEYLESLKKLGLRVGKNFSMQQECIIDESHCWLIKIGDDVTLAPRVHILAHDASTKRHLGYTKIGLVEIGNKTFIGAGTIIMPNTKIGTNCIIGAGSLVTKDIPDNSIAVGVPAKVINTTDKYLAKEKEQMKHRPVYDAKFTVREGITDEQKQKMIEDLKDGIGYVE